MRCIARNVRAVASDSDFLDGHGCGLPETGGESGRNCSQLGSSLSLPLSFVGTRKLDKDVRVDDDNDDDGGGGGGGCANRQTFEMSSSSVSLPLSPCGMPTPASSVSLPLSSGGGDGDSFAF